MSTPDSPAPAEISVVIPAHNESAVIDGTLQALLTDGSDRLEVIVVCNGCTDDTADRARRHGVTVVELETASKTAALNAGDRRAHHFPRFYVDADIAVTAGNLLTAARSFDDSIHAVSPAMHPVITGRPWAVRAFYDVWTQLPYCQSLIGSGVFGLDAQSRSRFSEFPDVIADDLFARLQVKPDERRVAPGCSFPLQTPRTAWSLVKVKTRAHLGQLQLRQLQPELFANEDAHHGRATAQLARDPQRWPHILTYVTVRLVARMRARNQLRRGASQRWERDETIR